MKNIKLTNKLFFYAWADCNKSKMVQILKIKFPIILKLNNNGGQFYKKILNFGYFQNCKFCINIKFEIEKLDYLRWKFWVENFESKIR